MPDTPADQDLPADSRRPVAASPRLVYDGDCGFCAYWARYWQRLTGGSVEYVPYQDVAVQHPDVPVADFQRAVQYFSSEGRRATAAEASFLTLSHAHGGGFPLFLYRRLPGFAWLSEASYAFIARHRAAFFRLSLILFGRDYSPPRHDLVVYLFLRVLGLVFLAAFASFGVQAQGLIGSHGISPLADLIDTIGQRAGPERFFLMPMVFWWNSSDTAIHAVCWAGAGLSLLLVLNVLPRLSLLLLYALYLSLLSAGQEFMSYQWDTYLLETGFLALLMTFSRRPGMWLLRWLLFRFMFMSGMVKLLSDDPNWWGLSALSYHFLTQPLPTPLAWYAAHLPPAVLTFATGCTFVVELFLPFLIFSPRRLRFAAAFGILLLQLCILLTGNYNWFNLQTMLLCLLLFDDAALAKLLPQALLRRLAAHAAPERRRFAAEVVIAALGALIVWCSLIQMVERFGGHVPAPVQAVEGVIEPLHLVNGYGLFAVMTTRRDEIVIEGSADGVEWRAYEFRYKPGDLARRPRWNIPYQPRLDWQMWFAALEDPIRLRWFSGFLLRILQNEPSVIALMEKNPFPDSPPLYVRAQFYEYHFSDADEKVRGLWWRRRPLGLYFPAARLRTN